MTAKAASETLSLEGKGQSDKVGMVGTAEASVLQKKVESFGDPRLYAISLVADAMSHSQQPLVPEMVMGGNGEGGNNGMLGTLMSLLVAEKIGVKVPQHGGKKEEVVAK